MLIPDVNVKGWVTSAAVMVTALAVGRSVSAVSETITSESWLVLQPSGNAQAANPSQASRTVRRPGALTGTPPGSGSPVC